MLPRLLLASDAFAAQTIGTWTPSEAPSFFLRLAAVYLREQPLRLVDSRIRLERLTNHRFAFAALVTQLQQHRERFSGETWNRAGSLRGGILNEQKLCNLALQLGHDVTRLLLTD